MANQQIKRLLRRRPEVDEAEFELLQSRVLARLTRIDPDGLETPATDPTTADAADAATAQPNPDDVEAEDGSSDVPASDGHSESGRVTTYELPEMVVGVMAMPGDDVWDPAPEAVSGATAVSDDVVRPDDVVAADDVEAHGVPTVPDDIVAKPEAVSLPSRSARIEPVVHAPKARTPSASPARKERTSRAPARSPVNAAPAPARSVASPAAARPAAARPAASAAKSTPPAVAAPYCPYCALLLDPPPEVNRRCPRCRERIVVKRVEGRAVYLTEASVLVFEAERKRMANAGRWTRERQLWLKVAAAVGAPAERVAKLQVAPLSEEVVKAARSLYTTTVERSFRTAKRERRWEDASRIKRDHAQALFRLAGSPIPPPEEVVRPHREGAAAALRGIGEMAREAELVSGKCCEICQADDGRTFRIAQELRAPRLPHPGCPKGLCRCDWYLAVRDQSMVRRHLRRRARTDMPAASRSA